MYYHINMKHFLNVWLTLLFTFYMLGLTLYMVLIFTYGFAMWLGYEPTKTTYIEIYSPSIVVLIIGAVVSWIFTRKIDQPVWLRVIAIFSFLFAWFTFYFLTLFLGKIFSFNSYIVTFVLFVFGISKFIVDRIIERKRGIRAEAQIPLRQ